MPVYNAGEFLHPCLNSILNQTYENWELIAINDHSLDDSLNIITGYAKQDSRIKVVTNSKNLGVASSLNKAIKLAKGDFLARMDADDIMYPSRLARQLKHLNDHPNIVLVGGQCLTINRAGEPTGKKTFPISDEKIRDMIYSYSPVQHPAIMINRQLVPKNFSWYNTEACPAEDIDLYFRLFKHGQFANLSSLVLKYRLYPESTSMKDPKLNFFKTHQARSKAIKRYHLSPPLKYLVISSLQRLVISLLPSASIYSIYLISRGIQPTHINLSLLIPNTLSRKTFSFSSNN